MPSEPHSSAATPVAAPVTAPAPGAPAVLDHLVLAVPDLAAAVEDLHRRTGLRAVPGGSHPGRGTHNALVGLEWRGGRRHYLELLAPDPGQPDVPSGERLLDLGDPGTPHLHGWAVRLTGQQLDEALDRARAAGVDAGEAVSAARDTPAGLRLSWRLAVPRPLGLGGVQPFLIDWGDGAHPADGDLPTLELVSLTLQHPDPRAAGRVLALLGVDLHVDPGPVPALSATLATPKGEVVLR